MYLPNIPLLGPLTPGTTQRHLVRLPGAALAKDEPRPLITVTGANPGRTLFVNAGLHGGEYPAIEAVIRLGNTLDPANITGTLILMPVLNLPAFRNRTAFVCPIDNVNPNRVFPGDPNGSYSEQMVHALIHEFVVHADAYIDLHGGDIPEALVPFVICRSAAGQAVSPGDEKSKNMALAFGLPYVLTVRKPVQAAKGSSSYVAAAECGVPAILAEAGGVGQLQEDAVALLMDGVVRVMRYLGMMADRPGATTQSQIPNPKPQGSSKSQASSEAEQVVHTTKREARRSELEAGQKPPRQSEVVTVLTAFEWVYANNAGMWYSRVTAGDFVANGQEIGAVGDLFGDTIETIVSPVSGRVLFLTINPSVQQNGLLMGIGVE